MTEPDSTPVFDPATDADAPVEETTPSEAPVEETTPSEAPVEETTPSETPVEETTPEVPVEEAVSEVAVEETEPTSDSVTVVSPEPIEVAPDAQVELDFNSPETNAEPVSGVPSSSAAVSDTFVLTEEDYDSVPEDSKAEPRNAETTHQATAEQVEGQE